MKCSQCGTETETGCAHETCPHKELYAKVSSQSPKLVLPKKRGRGWNFRKNDNGNE